MATQNEDKKTIEIQPNLQLSPIDHGRICHALNMVITSAERAKTSALKSGKQAVADAWDKEIHSNEELKRKFIS